MCSFFCKFLNSIKNYNEETIPLSHIPNNYIDLQLPGGCVEFQFLRYELDKVTKAVCRQRVSKERRQRFKVKKY